MEKNARNATAGKQLLFVTDVGKDYALNAVFLKYGAMAAVMRTRRLSAKPAIMILTLIHGEHDKMFLIRGMYNKKQTR